MPDMIAGVTTGVSNIPDAMATAILAGANPVQGLYAVMVGTLLAAIFGSSALMNVSASSSLAMTALLIVAGVQSIKSERIADVWATGVAPRFVMIVTLVLTLVIPLQQAVYVGIVLSMLAYFFITSSNEVRVKQIVPNADGSITEQAAPAELASEQITLMQIYGNMTFTGAETPEEHLPRVADAVRPVAILRLRAQDGIGSSFVAVLERYNQQIRTHGGLLMVAGVSRKVKGQLDRTGTTADILGEENVFVASTNLGASTRQAYAARRNGSNNEDRRNAPGQPWFGHPLRLMHMRDVEV